MTPVNMSVTGYPRACASRVPIRPKRSRGSTENAPPSCAPTSLGARVDAFPVSLIVVLHPVIGTGVVVVVVVVFVEFVVVT